MDLAISADQEAILGAIDALAKPYVRPPIHECGFALTSEALDAALAEAGFLDVAFDADLGLVTAALIAERLARLPYAVEAAASAIVRPLIGADLPRPLCLVEAGSRRPIRFLKPGATVVVVGDRVASFTASGDHLQTEETLYGYPMARLLVDPATLATTRHDASPEAVRSRWRLALAAEASGLFAAALASVSTYVSDRKQFGRALATFQALRHRLAEAEVRARGCYWLMLKAAGTNDPGDAALAALFAQDAATASVYDFHQFLGAMGMTLEHPLHLWTYRLKALMSDLGGRGGQGLAAADMAWGR